MLVRSIFMFVVLLASADLSLALSARRLPGENWKSAAARSLRSSTKVPVHFDIFDDVRLHGSESELFNAFGIGMTSAYNQKKPLKSLDLSRVPDWKMDESKIIESFQKIRDKRFLKDSEHPEIIRRVSWLYPDDGCFVRAQWMERMMDEMGYSKAGKVFAFGDLTVKTEYHPEGEVSWWYHVAIIYKKDKDTYLVFDPSIEAYRPVTLNEWAQKMSVKHPQQTSSEADSSMAFSICSANTMNPEDPCNDAKEESTTTLTALEDDFLTLEWKRAVELHRDPKKVLGDEPPWATPPNRGVNP